MIEYDIIQQGNTAKIKLRNYVVKNYCKFKRKRGKITEFSNKSRRRMITRILQSKEFGFWIDLTLADDVVSDRLKETLSHANKAMKNFRTELKRKYKNLYMIYKREWVKRKSGIKKGSLACHYHCLVRGIDEHEVLGIMRLWVRMTGTKDENAIKVAINSKSFRKINNYKVAIKYISKYITKKEEKEEIKMKNESIGKNWGYIGNREENECEKKDIIVYKDEMVLIKRMLRRYYKNNKRIKALLEIPNIMIYCEKKVLTRMIECARKEAMSRLLENWGKQL